ncbi:hypothetical protein [Natrinema marinum]|uniref:hypothetical protein n=1 Tax=Natrinema marinum TaxID=2961598 RepID=UPI0020C92943|nr:hypothetical protein [Natrinema marinum]
MKRRGYVAALGASVASLAGLTAFAKPDLLLTLGKGTRGTGDDVSVTKSIDGEEVSYLEETNEVRYPTAYAGGEPQRYATEDFRTWAKRRSAPVGSTAVLSTIEDRLAVPVDGVGKSVGRRVLSTVIFVEYLLPREENGYPPDLSFQKVASATPRTVHATVVLEGKQYTRAVPVIARRSNQGQPN